jgi:hypothetical protein
MSETSGGAPKEHACVSISSSSLVEVCQSPADCGGAAGPFLQRRKIDVDGWRLHCCGAAPCRPSSHARSRSPRRRRRWWEGRRWGWSRRRNRRTWRRIWRARRLCCTRWRNTFCDARRRFALFRCGAYPFSAYRRCTDGPPGDRGSLRQGQPRRRTCTHSAGQRRECATRRCREPAWRPHPRS